MVGDMWSIENLQPHMVGFVLETRLDSGGFKHTYRATDEESGNQVALKVFIQPEGEDEEPQSGHLRAAREIRLLEDFDHPRIVRIAHASSFVEINGQRYLNYCEEFIPNGTLKHLSLPLSPAQTRVIVEGLVDALAYLEERGVVHRDIKPGNIGLADSGEPVLLDFGVALDGEDDDITGLMDVAPGTRAYAAPEQFLPRRLITLDHRADQHALGVLAQQLLTGSLRPSDEDWATCDISDCFREITTRLTADRPNLRYRRTEMLRAALEECDE